MWGKLGTVICDTYVSLQVIPHSCLVREVEMIPTIRNYFPHSNLELQ